MKLSRIVQFVRNATLLARRDTSIRCSRCGHSYDTHTHHRRGTDCGLCGKATCPAFKL